MNGAILVAVCVLLAVVLVLSALFFKQVKGFFALILNTIAGWAGLYIFNTVFAAAGISLGINIASASLVGVLGVPGLLLMIVLKFVYK